MHSVADERKMAKRNNLASGSLGGNRSEFVAFTGFSRLPGFRLLLMKPGSLVVGRVKGCQVAKL
jgi:hypothetical protein